MLRGLGLTVESHMEKNIEDKARVELYRDFWGM